MYCTVLSVGWVRDVVTGGRKIRPACAQPDTLGSGCKFADDDDDDAEDDEDDVYDDECSEGVGGELYGLRPKGKLSLIRESRINNTLVFRNTSHDDDHDDDANDSLALSSQSP